MAEVTEADHIFKTRYGQKLISLLREEDKLQKMFPFSKGELVGEKFVEAVDLEYEHGFTYAGNETAPSLRAAISADGEKAEVTPSQIIGRKKVGYRDMFRSNGAGEKAFTPMAVKKFKDLALGMRRNIEISLLHGQGASGIGVVGAAVSGQVITINVATWAPGIWMGSINSVIDVYESDGETLRQGNLVVSAVDESTRAITVTGTVTGITTGDIIYRDTANVTGTMNECAGLQKILATASGNLFGVSVTGHPLWKPSAYDFAGPISMGKLLKAAAKAHIKGLSGTAVALIPTRAFEVLNEQLSGSRVFDASYKSQEALNGVEAIAYHYQGGKLLVVPHSMMFEGHTYLFPLDEQSDVADRPLKRIGSVDMTFELPDNEGKIFLHTTDAASKEIRNYTDQCLFFNRCGQGVYGTGITYP